MVLYILQSLISYWFSLTSYWFSFILVLLTYTLVLDISHTVLVSALRKKLLYERSRAIGQLSILKNNHSFPMSFAVWSIYSVNLRIQSEYRKIRTINNSVFGHFSRSMIDHHHEAEFYKFLNLAAWYLT